MQLVYPYALIGLLTLTACTGEKNTSDSASDSSTTATASASDTSATTANPTTDGTTDPNPTSTTTSTTTTSATTDGPTTGTTTDVPETGVVDGTQTVIEDACAPDDGPALEFKFAVAGDGCSADWPEDAPIVRILLFQGGPLAPGSYTLDNGNGFATFDDGNSVLMAQTGKIDLIDWNSGFPIGAIDITFSPDVHLVEAFSATFCETNPPCG